MTPNDPTTNVDTGIIPSVNDVAAGLIVTLTYVTRIASVGETGFQIPWYLTLTTDVILPMLAGIYLFAAASVVLTRRLSGKRDNTRAP